MNKKSNLVSYFVLIFFIGVISTVLSSDNPLGAMIQNWQNYDIEVLLEYLSLGLGFLAISSILIYLVVRAARGKEASWLEQVLRDKQENDRQDS